MRDDNVSTEIPLATGRAGAFGSGFAAGRLVASPASTRPVVAGRTS